jgi:hypothetical protein
MKNFSREDEKLRQTKPTKGAGAVPLMHAAYNLATERLPVRFVQQTRARRSWASLRQTEASLDHGELALPSSGEPRDEASPEP